MRFLTFTTLYPNSEFPHHGVFVEERLRHYMDAHGGEVRVVAPVPWFPSRNPRFGTYARYPGVPARESRHGIDVLHPHYPVVPRVGMNLAPFLLAMGAWRSIRQLQREGFEFDFIDAHYFYPDGVAAALLAWRLSKPLVITARGTDLNLIPRYRIPRAMIRKAAGRATRLVTVCQALEEVLRDLGVAGDKTQTLRNGVDLDLFRPLERERLRRDHGLAGKTVISAGHLTARKGHDIVIRALSGLPDVTLLIIGEGEEEGALRALAAQLGMTERVRFVGRIPHERMPEFYNLADLLVLASSREGWANVLLEALACGTPVVASSIWGTPEVVRTAEAGRLVAVRTPEAFATAIREQLASVSDRGAARRYAEKFGWDETVDGLHRMFSEVGRG